MRIRHLITANKMLQSDTGWKNSDIKPKHAPVFPKTTPIGAGWEWRSGGAICNTTGRYYVLLAKCNPNKGNWQATLMLSAEDGASVVSRFEHHGTRPGLHAHAHCDRGGIETGPKGMDLPRIPAASNRHRRIKAWMTKNEFWEAAKTFFRVHDKKGPLI